MYIACYPDDCPGGGIFFRVKTCRPTKVVRCLAAAQLGDLVRMPELQFFLGDQLYTRCWFQIIFIFTPTWGNDPI